MEADASPRSRAHGSHAPSQTVSGANMASQSSADTLAINPPAKNLHIPSYASPTMSRSNSNMAPSPSKSTSSIGGAPSPSRLRRTSSSLSHNRAPSFSSPRMQRKESISSLRSMTSSPAVPSPRRPPSVMDFGRSTSTLPQTIEEAPLTATSVASEFFTRELLSHDDEHATAETVVIIHDACYGHRFSRPKTSKTALSMIVERPERILACALGVSAAYVRLGSRHKDGSHAPHPDKAPDSTLPFKIRKSFRSVDLTSAAVVAVHGKTWMEELQIMCDAAGMRLATGAKELARPDMSEIGPKDTAHKDAGHKDALHKDASQQEKAAFHEGDLYLCAETLNALQGAIGGVCDAVDAIFDNTPNAPKRAFVAVRPPGHHCSSDWPSGFCWINNVHIGIEYAAQNYGLTHAVILDFDLHHGDGSQDITWDHNTKSAAMPKNAPFSKKTAIGYYSMHDINSYPCEWSDKEKVQNASLCIDNAHGQSIWNVHLQPWRTMDEFWELYETKYRVLLAKASTFLEQHTARIKATPKQIPPKAAIFISAGFDASEWEGAGMQRHAVNVPTEFYARFTQDVVKLAQEHDTAVDGRVISVLEGGYSDRALTSGVLSHLSGLTQHAVPVASPGAEEMVSAIQRMNIAAMGIDAPVPQDDQRGPDYNTAWWHADNLTALENYITPPPPLPVPKRTGRSVVPTYATPTESFTHKVINPESFKRSVSSTMRHVSHPISKPSSKPPPDVDWIVATHELSKLLIPTDRQTTSCKPEDLAAPRVKKDRLSGPAAIPVDTGRQLRGRKAKTPPVDSTGLTSSFDMDDITESMRRQTISDLPMSSHPLPVQPAGRTTRRTSQLFSAETSDLMPPTPSDPTIATAPRSSTPVSGAPKTRRLARPPAAKPETARKVPPRPASVMPRAPPRDAPVPTSRTSSSLGSYSSAPGPKRITLKLGTREQSEKKVQEKLEAEKRERREALAKEKQLHAKVIAERSKADEKAKKLNNSQPTRAHDKPHVETNMPASTSAPVDIAFDGEKRIGTPTNTVPQLALHVPTPKAEMIHQNLPLRPTSLSSRQDSSSSATAAGAISGDNAIPVLDRKPSNNSTTDNHPLSPPVFTPTFMSQIMTPEDYRSRSTSAEPPIPRGAEVKYEFNPKHEDREILSPQEAMNEDIRQSMITHPNMIVSDNAPFVSPPEDESRGLVPHKTLSNQDYGRSNSATGHGKERLPVFTSTGAIPFAPTHSSRPGSQGVGHNSYGFSKAMSGLGISESNATADRGNAYGQDVAPLETDASRAFEIPGGSDAAFSEHSELEGTNSGMTGGGGGCERKGDVWEVLETP